MSHSHCPPGWRDQESALAGTGRVSAAARARHWPSGTEWVVLIAHIIKDPFVEGFEIKPLVQQSAVGPALVCRGRRWLATAACRQSRSRPQQLRAAFTGSSITLPALRPTSADHGRRAKYTHCQAALGRRRRWRNASEGGAQRDALSAVRACNHGSRTETRPGSGWCQPFKRRWKQRNAQCRRS